MKVVLVGGGPANLYLAFQLLDRGHTVHLYEKTTSVGKKLLVAGKSGLNITHSEPIEEFSKKYFELHYFFLDLLQDFSNTDLIKWLESQGIKTFIGSSKRVFPESFKASEILKTWTDKLKSHKNFKLITNHNLTKIQKDSILFNQDREVHFDKIVYGLGGASWSKTGSDGNWKKLFEEHSIRVVPFQASNCGFDISWSSEFKDKFEIAPLKNIAVRFNDSTIKGELMLTQYGIEGTPIYSLSCDVRKEIDKSKEATITIDLKPDLSIDQVREKLKKKRAKDSLSNHLRKSLGLDRIIISFLKEFSSKEDFTNNLAYLIKNYPLKLQKVRPIEEAISTSGGISMDEVNKSLELKKLPNHYVIGEMLDWDTITGGYLLQGCFSMGHRVFKVITGV